MDSTRRTFLKLGVSLAGAGAGFGVLAGQSAAEARPSRARIPTPASVRKGDMLYRTLGQHRRTGVPHRTRRTSHRTAK